MSMSTVFHSVEGAADLDHSQNSATTEAPATKFERRHIGPSPKDMQEMLKAIAASSIETLISETIPDSIRQKAPLGIGEPLSETEALARIRAIAEKNIVFTSLI